MKNSIITGLVLLSVSSFGQVKEETIKKEYSFEKAATTNVFRLANITGSINVIVHNDGKIVLEARKIVHAKTNERLEDGMKETGIALLDRFDTLIVYASSSCHNFKKRDDKIGYAYAWDNCELKYEYKFDMKLYVPKGTNLVLSTVNDGDIRVDGVEGDVNVKNVNGDISLDNVKGKVVAHTINGDLDVNYAANPRKDSKYYTLNGDIKANFKAGLAAKISFKSFNGDMYSNLPALESLPGELTVEKADGDIGVKYKIDDRKLMQTRNGKIILDFETFNGDAYIKEQ